MKTKFIWVISKKKTFEEHIEFGEIEENFDDEKDFENYSTPEEIDENNFDANENVGVV
ncbi:hypothetical protein [Peribacillus muralis]|uniref:hypothetical protein n=1 Tax=Peribacillus muralis TaxID=264697 RepID=UPI0013798E76|nr:hypothetical protein [Peribacillus muralis]